MNNLTVENHEQSILDSNEAEFSASFFGLLANVPLDRASPKLSNMHRVANKFAELSGNDVREDVFLSLITDLVKTGDLSKDKALQLVRLYLEKFK
jgi:hypothetical protein